jgi:tetratricopeptide (TPR) repeat protein
MNFILAPSSTCDLDRLSQYFLKTNVEAGERLFKALNQKFYNLTQFPNLGKPYPHLPPSIRGLLKDLTKEIDIDPNTKYCYFTRAATYCYLGLKKQAIEDFTTVIQLESNADVYYNRVVTYYQSKNYKSAIEDLDMAINLDSNSVSAYYNRGNAKYELQDQGAVQDYNRAKFISSNGAVIVEDEHGFYARGIAHVRLKNEANAIKDFQRAETLCLDHGNTSLLKQIRLEIEKIST